MLDGDLLVDAIVLALQSIPELVDAVNNQDKIYGHKYLYGKESRIDMALAKMEPPSILVAWEGVTGGNTDSYNKMVVWMHRFSLYIRTPNVAAAQEQISYAKMWRMICMGNLVGNGFDGFHNIRNTQIYSLPDGSPGVEIMDPDVSIGRIQDAEGMDMFKAIFKLEEIGDN